MIATPLGTPSTLVDERMLGNCLPYVLIITTEFVKSTDIINTLQLELECGTTKPCELLLYLHCNKNMEECKYGCLSRC